MTRYFTSKEKHYYFMLIGATMLVSSTALMMYTFFSACLSPDKTVYVTVNTFGLNEWWFEAPMILASIPFTVYAAFFLRNYLGDLRDKIDEADEFKDKHLIRNRIKKIFASTKQERE